MTNDIQEPEDSRLNLTDLLGAVDHTARGFEIINFSDCYGVKCSLQASSLAEYEKPGTSAIWLGVQDASPIVMASDAAKVGVETKETCGWVPYPVPEQVQMTTRMHLKREQVAALIQHLQSWMDNDTFQVSTR
jgi:hypothetical protein